MKSQRQAKILEIIATKNIEHILNYDSNEVGLTDYNGLALFDEDSKEFTVVGEKYIATSANSGLFSNDSSITINYPIFYISKIRSLFF